MATLKQIEANRRNALLSTGPSTPEGKAAVRLNALRHGLRAHTVVLPGENPENFQQLCDDLAAEWQPQTRTEQLYVEQMAVSQWKLRRMEIAEASLLVQKFGAKNQIPLVDRLWQAESRLERSFTRAQRELERLQKSRREQPRDQPAEADGRNPTSEIRNPSPEGRNPTSEIRHPSHAAPLAEIPQPARLEPDSRQDFKGGIHAALGHYPSYISDSDL